jgi:hypothetical protein
MSAYILIVTLTMPPGAVYQQTANATAAMAALYILRLEADQARVRLALEQLGGRVVGRSLLSLNALYVLFSTPPSRELLAEIRAIAGVKAVTPQQPNFTGKPDVPSVSDAGGGRPGAPVAGPVFGPGGK